MAHVVILRASLHPLTALARSLPSARRHGEWPPLTECRQFALSTSGSGGGLVPGLTPFRDSRKRLAVRGARRSCVSAMDVFFAAHGGPAAARPKARAPLSAGVDPHKIPIDPNGNLLSKVDGTDAWGYEWNARNELSRVTRNSAEIARFVYDPKGRRVEVAGGVTTSYTYAHQAAHRTAPEVVSQPGTRGLLQPPDRAALMASRGG